MSPGTIECAYAELGFRGPCTDPRDRTTQWPSGILSPILPAQPYDRDTAKPVKLYYNGAIVPAVSPSPTAILASQQLESWSIQVREFALSTEVKCHPFASPPITPRGILKLALLPSMNFSQTKHLNTHCMQLSWGQMDFGLYISFQTTTN